MTLPDRETTRRAALGLVYPSDDRQIRRVDRFALLNLFDVDGFDAPIKAEISVLPRIIAKGSIDPAYQADFAVQPRRA